MCESVRVEGANDPAVVQERVRARSEGPGGIAELGVRPCAARCAHHHGCARGSTSRFDRSRTRGRPSGSTRVARSTRSRPRRRHARRRRDRRSERGRRRAARSRPTASRAGSRRGSTDACRRVRCEGSSRSRARPRSTRGSADPSVGSTTSSLTTSRGAIALGVPLPNADPVAPVRRDAPVRVAVAPTIDRRRDGNGIRARIDAVEALVVELRAERDAAMDAVGAASVLVHGRADVEAGRNDVDPTGPRDRRLTSTTRPISAARPSSHQTTPSSIHGADKRTPASATISAEIGDDHVPYAATVF